MTAKEVQGEEKIISHNLVLKNNGLHKG